MHVVNESAEQMQPVLSDHEGLVGSFELGDESAKIFDPLSREVRGWFIEKKQVDISHQRAGAGDPLKFSS